MNNKNSINKWKISRRQNQLNKNPLLIYLYDSNKQLEYLNKLDNKITSNELSKRLNTSVNMVNKYIPRELRKKYLLYGQEAWRKNESDEHKKIRKEKMSNSMKNIWNNYNDDEKIKRLSTRTYYQHSIETRAKISKNTKKAMNTEEIKSNLVNSIQNRYLRDNPNRNLIYNKELLEDYLKRKNNKITYYDLSIELGIPYTTIVANITEEMKQKYIKQSGRNSKFQTDIFNYIKSIINSKLIYNDRQTIKPLELDIYIPEYKLAIECNGLYFHQYNGQNKDYHYNKYLKCKENGIRLIQIWDFEWYDIKKRPILENIIKYSLNLINNKIYARNCILKEIKDKNIIKDFLNINHIQGNRSYKDAIGLFYNNELVMIYTLGKAFFGKGKYDIEIIRVATKLNTIVVGGMSKIWNYIINNYMPLNNLKSCVYYVNNDYYNSISQNNLNGLQYITHNISYKNYFIETGEIKNRNPRKNKEVNELIKQGKVIKFYTSGSDVYVYIIS